MASILETPAEMIIAVLEYLPAADLSSLCRADQRLRTHAEPLLYSEIHWTWLQYETPPIDLLLRSLVRRPELARHIQRVTLKGATFFSAPFQGRFPPKIPTTMPAMDEIVAFVQNTKFPYRDVWIQELRSGTMDAFVALLLSQTWNLKSLCLDQNFTKGSRLFGMMLRSALCDTVDYGLPKFEHLQEVEFIGRPDIDFRPQLAKNTADVLPFFYLPAIRRISAWIDHPPTFTWPAHTPDSASLESLELKGMREEHLGQILSVTRKLKSLHWTWYWNPEMHGQPRSPDLDLAKLGAALSYPRETLTNLKISALCECDNGGFFPHIGARGSLAALVKCNKIKQFKVPYLLLMGFSSSSAHHLKDVIPRNVEHLTLSDDLYEMDDDTMDVDTQIELIGSWLEERRLRKAHVRGITLVHKLSIDEWSPEMSSSLQAMCEKAEAKLEIVLL